MEYWGYHLILDCKNCDLEKIQSPDYIKDFVETLVDKIEMIPFGEPNIQHFATHNSDAAGFSLVQLIETSSITGHFVDKSGDAYLDIFSCKKFDTKKVEELVKSFFNPKKISTTYLTRQA
jgi:S-adenosylmethionine/arginine decarboxylase-like enzyme